MAGGELDDGPCCVLGGFVIGTGGEAARLEVCGEPAEVGRYGPVGCHPFHRGELGEAPGHGRVDRGVEHELGPETGRERRGVLYPEAGEPGRVEGDEDLAHITGVVHWCLLRREASVRGHDAPAATLGVK